MANQPGPWQRFMDTFIHAAEHSPLGGEGLARAYFKHVKGKTDEEINRAIAAEDADYDKKYKDAPVFQSPTGKGKPHGLEYLDPENIGRGATSLLGTVLGGVDPTYLFGGFGKNVVRRIVSQAAGQGGASVVRQQVEKNTGQRKKIDPKQVLTDAALGAVFQGGAEGIAKTAKTAKRMVMPDEIHVDDLVPVAPEDLGQPHVVADEQPSVQAQAETNEALAPAPESPTPTPREHGPFVEHSEDAQGNKSLTYKASNGETLPIKMGIDPDGTAEIAIDQFSTKANRLGPREIRSAMNDLMDMYPEIKRFGGYRRSGAGKGRVQEIEPNRPVSSTREDLGNQYLSEIEDLGRQHDAGKVSNADYDTRIADIENRYKFIKEPEAAPEDMTSIPPADPIQNIRDRFVAPEVREFHGNLMSRVADKAAAAKQAGDALHDSGELPYKVGDQFLTPKAKEAGQDPWTVVGHYVDPKNPERYGYRVERGAGEDREAGTMLVSDPAADARRPEYDRKADVSKWENLSGSNEHPFVDASAEGRPPLDNTGYEKHTPYVETPAPDNDVNRVDAAKKFVKNILDDESGSLGYRDKNVEPEPEYPESIHKLAKALRDAVPARAKTKTLYSEERSRRVAEMAKARHATSGIEGFHAEKSKLKGELPTAEYEGLHGLEQADINELFDHVKNHPNLGWLQSISARDGLTKILQGQVPTSSEISLLSRTMPPELIRSLMKNRNWFGKAMDAAANVLNVPKALMASYDISAPLRQGVFLIGRKEFYSSLAPMVKSFGSPKYAAAVRENIYRDPLFAEMQDSGLSVPVFKGHNNGPHLAELEEPYMTNLAQHIPVVGLGVRASERAYTTFVYKLRADTFRTLYHAGRAAGKQWDHQSLKDLSKFINTFTGRGDLGKFNNAAPILNSALFSPKLLKSRIDSLNPKFYASLDPFVRKEALKSILSFATIAGTALGLAKLAGAEVGADPRKADGWKIKVGDTRYDILGGEQQLVRLLGNVGTYAADKGKQVATTGKIKSNYKDKTAIDNVGQFLRNKESPDVSLAHDFLAGRDAIGRDFNAETAIGSRVTPLSAQDWYSAADDLRKNGAPVDEAIIKGLIKSSPGLLGVGVQTYPPHVKSSKAKKDSNFPALGGDPLGGSNFKEPF